MTLKSPYEDQPLKIRTRTEPDLIGQKFNMLTVMEPAWNREPGGKSRKGWWCRCECKKVTFKSSNELLGDKTFSCGCTKRGMYSHFSMHHALPVGAKMDPMKFIPSPLLEWEPCYYVSEAV